MAPQLISPRQFSSAQVVIRFVVRLMIFCVFASFGGAGFRVMFPTFLILSAIYCAIAGNVPGRSVTWPHPDSLGRSGGLHGPRLSHDEVVHHVVSATVAS